MKKTVRCLIVALLPLLASAQPVISFQTITNALTQPVDVEQVNDGTGRLFIVERGGTIRIWDGSSLLTNPFLNVSTIITSSGSEQGLLSLAFHPDYLNNGYFFIYYTNTAGSITIARYSRTNANSANPSSGVVLMTIPKNFSNHNGGNLVFGTDGYLYFGTGDGGSGGDPDNNAQNGGSLLGKMLRIDVNNPNPPYYSIPPTNPYATSITIKKEIIAMGLRNPWRWSFDKQTGDMWIADVGQGAWEEVNVVTSSNRLDKNYGWKCYEGNHVYGSGCTVPAGTIFPIFEYGHNSSTGGYSITGGYRYRGSEYPWLQGYYLCSDYVSKNGWLVYENGSGGWNATQQTNWAPAGGISSFGEALDGTLYAVSLSGSLYKVIASNPLHVKLVSFAARQSGNKTWLTWEVQNEQAGDQYVLEQRRNPDEAFTEIFTQKVVKDNPANRYSIGINNLKGTAYYRLKIMSVDGNIHYSQAVVVNQKEETVRAFTQGGQLYVSFPEGASWIEVYDFAGRKLHSEKVNASNSVQSYSLSPAGNGILAVRILVNEEWQVVKVVH